MLNPSLPVRLNDSVLQTLSVGPATEQGHYMKNVFKKYLWNKTFYSPNSLIIPIPIMIPLFSFPEHSLMWVIQHCCLSVSLSLEPIYFQGLHYSMQVSLKSACVVLISPNSSVRSPADCRAFTLRSFKSFNWCVSNQICLSHKLPPLKISANLSESQLLSCLTFLSTYI